MGEATGLWPEATGLWAPLCDHLMEGLKDETESLPDIFPTHDAKTPPKKTPKTNTHEKL